jgi:NAD(P)-dependent dehydrogenase (short-subunit alcohol dehydrogenase family)
MSEVLKNKVVVITGGAGLLGREFCGAIAASGGIAVIADRKLEDAKHVATKIAQAGGLAHAVELDITHKDSVNACITGLHQRFGRIDAVVNNAYPRNAHYGRRLEEVTYEDFCDNVGMHVGGYFLVSQQFAAYFKKQGCGNIVNMSSIYGVVAPRFEIYEGTSMTMPVEYAVIKSGVLHLTRYMAKYLKGNGIRVNAISPGGILAGQPAPFLERYKQQCTSKGMLDKSDLTGTLVFLLSDESVYINGQNLTVDDGFSL